MPASLIQARVPNHVCVNIHVFYNTRARACSMLCRLQSQIRNAQIHHLTHLNSQRQPSPIFFSRPRRNRKSLSSSQKAALSSSNQTHPARRIPRRGSPYTKPQNYAATMSLNSYINSPYPPNPPTSPLPKYRADPTPQQRKSSSSQSTAAP
jgi:hypothetical protein